MPLVEIPVASAQVELRGDNELFRRMEDLAVNVRDKAIRKALREGVKPVIATAKALVPVHYGFLRESLGVRTVKYRRSQTIVAVVGARHGELLSIRKIRASLFLTEGASGKGQRAAPSKYAHLVEKGTSSHTRAPKRRTVYERLTGRSGSSARGPWRWRDESGNWHTWPDGIHPGAKAQPFLEPAFKQTKALAYMTMRNELRRFLERMGK